MTQKPPLLEVRDLSKRFGGLLATQNVSFSVAAGSLTALIGPNGAGKTTLFNLVTNLFRPDSGDIRLAGRSLLGLTSQQIAALGLIRTFQTARVFPGMTILENVLSGRHRLLRAGMLAQMVRAPAAREEERSTRGRALGLLEVIGLADKADVHAVELPMGAQKLLEIARALMARPKLLLLDEPAAGLNDSETADLADLLLDIRSCGITVLLVEHNMPLVMGVADHVLVLEAGQLIAEGPPAVVQKSERVIAAYLGDGRAAGC